MTDEPDIVLPKRNLALPGLIVVALLAVGGYLGYDAFIANHPTPDRVLVMVDIAGSDEAARRTATEVRGTLRGLGFVVVDPALVTEKGSPAEIARKHDAGLLLTGKISVSETTPIVEGKSVEVVLDGEFQVRESSEDFSEEDVRTIPIRWVDAGPDQVAATEAAAVELARLRMDEITVALVSMPSVDTLFTSDELTVEQKEWSAQLKRAYNFVDQRNNRLAKKAALRKRVAESYADDDRGTPRPTTHTDYGLESYLVDVLAGGEGVVATVNEKYAFMDVEKMGVDEAWMPERQVAIDAEGTSTTLFETETVLGYPTLTADGTKMVAVSDDHELQISLRLLEIAVDGSAETQSTTLAAVEKGYLGYPVIRRDGAKVLFTHRDCRRCNSSLEIINPDGTDRKTLFKATLKEGVANAKFVSDSLVSYVIWVDGGDRRFVTHNLADDSITDVHTDGEGIFHINEFWSRDGKLLAYIKKDEGGRHVAVRDMATGKVRRIMPNVHTKRPRFSHDARYLAFEAATSAVDSDSYTRDAEIAVIDLSDPESTPRVLTVNRVKDRHIRWAPDRHTVYFESLYPVPDTRRKWVLIRSIPVTPTADGAP